MGHYFVRSAKQKYGDFDMYCGNCGEKLANDAKFCPKCGFKVKGGKSKSKNIYIAFILTFVFSGLGSIYAGNVEKGLRLLGLRIIFAVVGLFVGIFSVLSMLVWVYSFYEAYKDVEIANGNSNPNLINDFQDLNPSSKKKVVIFVLIILVIAVVGSVGFPFVGDHSYDDSKSHYYSSGSSSSGSSGSSGSSHSSHYSGVDDSPHTIAKNDPDWYYDHYDYGDYDDIDEYLESQGYD